MESYVPWRYSLVATKSMINLLTDQKMIIHDVQPADNGAIDYTVFER